MKEKDFEVRVMNYFAENINLQKYWDIAKRSAKEICNMRFGDIISGEFEIPSDEEMKKIVSDHVPYEFDAEDFMHHGPVDFSGLDDNMISEAIAKIESLYKRFHEAQARAVAKAATHAAKKLAENLKAELNQIKNKYLS